MGLFEIRQKPHGAFCFCMASQKYKAQQSVTKSILDAVTNTTDVIASPDRGDLMTHALPSESWTKLFEDERNYLPTDPEVVEVMGDGDRQAQLRHKGKSPSYYRIGRKIIYRGADINAWMQSLRIEKTQAA